jgi:hypothetical protein
MLPFNRVYTPQELLTASRLTPAERQPLGVVRMPVERAASRRTLAALLQRLTTRGGLRRPRPRTT